MVRMTNLTLLIVAVAGFLPSVSALNANFTNLNMQCITGPDGLNCKACGWSGGNNDPNLPVATGLLDQRIAVGVDPLPDQGGNYGPYIGVEVNPAGCG